MNTKRRDPTASRKDEMARLMIVHNGFGSGVYKMGS